MFSNGNIEINLQGIGWEGVDWINGLSIGTDVGPCECSNEHLGSMKCGQVYVLFTVHLGIILVNNQLDAQFFFLIRLLQFSTCFEQHRAHHQEN
jgi:hypothetical protein